MMLSSGQLFLAGSFAGLANGVVSGPVEHIRISEFISSSRASYRRPRGPALLSKTGVLGREC